MPLVDGVRAVAAGLVFLEHAGSQTGLGQAAIGPFAHAGQSGVAIFFVLSGFLLYRPFVTGRVDLRSYAIRRAARILPAYWVALVALSLLTGRDDFWTHAGTYLLFLQNFDRDLFHGFLGASWTLQLEVAFYALLPLIALLVARASAGVTRRLMLVLGIVGAGSLLLGQLVYRSAESAGTWRDLIWVADLFPLMLWMFVAGMVLAVLFERRPTRLAWMCSPAAGLAGAALIGLALLIGTQYQEAITVLGAVLLVGAVAPVASVPRCVATTSVTAGALSYAFFLWHRDVLQWLVSHDVTGWSAVGIGLAISIAAAALSYALVERPAIDAGRRLSDRTRAGRPGTSEPRLEQRPQSSAS